jgi:hypothetical protein
VKIKKMSELLDNSVFRKSKLKELILKLHEGVEADKIKEELKDSLRQIPYGEVVEVEQELIEEGLPEDEILRLCDIHSEVLEGHVDLTAMKIVPPGHPVDVMRQENIELRKVIEKAKKIIASFNEKDPDKKQLLELEGLFNAMLDVDKHYLRKEYLIFPFLEQKGITGPPKVMWGKHDEIRSLLKGSIEILQTPDIEPEEIVASAELILSPALNGVDDMIGKEEEILLPMCLDQLTEADWYQVHQQTLEIGFCLYDPPYDWKPDNIETDEKQEVSQDHMQLPTGSFKTEELLAVLNTLPVDMTFVDKDDKVKYFSQNKDRIFQRNRAIINRDVRHCHPPGSTHIVDKILQDFKSGKQDHAPFWIQMGEKFIHIEYFALRNEKGEYLGTLEVSQDLTGYRKLEGEQRILSYK